MEFGASMNIFVLNRGSSSIKCYLYHFKNSAAKLVWEAQVQWKNTFENPSLSIKNEQGMSYSEVAEEKGASLLLEHLISLLISGKTAALNSFDEVHAIGHRIVHGGQWFSDSVRVTSDVKEKIRRLSELAPLHNLPELEGIELLEKCFPKVPQIAVFDTAFHHTLPKATQIYPGPYQWYEEGIRRYGFHGISFQYCTKRASEILNQDLKRLRMVICHLGSGASLCAVKEGMSIDTTMGFTPLDGLMMDTRCGSIDPGIILYFLEKKKRSAEEISRELYKDSGLLGVSGISSDMRDIIEKSLNGDVRTTLALEVYLHRLHHLIGSMIASLKGIDVLIFTAGIGENAALLRKKVCENFSFLGFKLDYEQNERSHEEDCVLSAFDSKVKILLIHTQEALEIARECLKNL
jgi:acetate kinase